MEALIMTHLRIEQNNIQENVSNSIIKKLYDLASSGDLDNTSNLAGLIHTDITYRMYTTYLTTMFPDLTITADTYAIPFEDQNMVTYLNSIGVGSNDFITETQSAAATVVANSPNTTVTKFNELRYFTSITSSKGGVSGTSDGNVRFLNWTALEEVDISNFTSLGHNNESGYGDTFCGCTALKTVTASNKLEYIGCKGFCNCTNLEDITGLSGTIGLHRDAFSGCSKLKNSNFTNVEFVLNHRNAFYNCKLLTSILLSTSCIDIPQSTFEECSGLTTVTGLSNATTIGERCFLNCGALTNVDIDWSKITTIYSGGFQSSGLPGNISLPNITNLNERAFYGTKITSLTVGGSITSVPYALCYNCTNLTTVSVPTTVTTLSNACFQSCSALTTISGLSNVTTIGQSAFISDTSLSTHDIDFTKVTDLGGNSFQNCRALTGSINLSSVTTTGTYVFANTRISSITIGGTIQDVPGQFCYGCSSLTSITFGSNIKSLGYASFSLCSGLTTLDLSGTSITYIGQQAFNGCTNLSSITLPSTLQTLDSNALRSTKITSITIPSSVTSIGVDAFTQSKLASITFDNNSQLNSIGGGAFNGTLLTSIDIPDSCTLIDNNAFYYCRNLSSVTVGTGIQTMNSPFTNAVGGLVGGFTLTVKATTPPTLTLTQGGITAPNAIYVPAASVQAYKQANGWSTYASIIQAIPT